MTYIIDNLALGQENRYLFYRIDTN